MILLQCQLKFGIRKTVHKIIKFHGNLRLNESNEKIMKIQNRISVRPIRIVEMSHPLPP